MLELFKGLLLFVCVCSVLSDGPLCIPDTESHELVCSPGDIPQGDVYTSYLISIVNNPPDEKLNLSARYPPSKSIAPMSTDEVFKPNTRIDEQNEKLFDFLAGPESLAKQGDTLYAAASNAIYKVDMKTGHHSIIFDGNKDAAKRGGTSRPLGLRVRGNQLFCADGLLGLLEINLGTGVSRTVLSVGTLVGGKPFTFPDDIDVDFENQIVYLSDGSTKHDLHNWAWSVLQFENTGRVLKINVTSGHAEVFAENIHFANGIQISIDKKHLLVDEFSARKILKYNLSDDLPASPSVFVDRLPGNPDNIRPSLNGGYWLAMALSRDNGTPTLFDHVQANDKYRQDGVHCAIFAKGADLENTGILTSNKTLENLGSEIKTGSIFIKTIPRVGTVLELDANGKILQVLHSRTVDFFTEVQEYEDGLLLGSYTNPFVLKVPKKVFRTL